MSQIVKTETKSATMPKTQLKAFNAFKIEPFVHSLIFGKGLSHADTIRPSDIGMNSHAAKSALGGGVSVPGFVTGLAWALCALAHGQKKLAALQEGLPVASAYALEHGASHFKPGAGISAGSLEAVVLVSLKAMLSLPAPAKRVTEAPAETAAEAPAETAAETAAEAPAETAAEAPAEAPAETAIALAEASAASEGEAEKVSYVRAVTSLPRDEAEQQLRAIALALGFRLVRIKAA